MSRCPPKNMKKLIVLAALLSCSTAAASAATPPGIVTLKGTVQFTSAEGQILLKTGEALPSHLPPSFSMTVLEGWVELALGSTRLKTEGGGICSLSVNETGYNVQTQPGSSAIQLTDSCGNVAVVTDKSAFETAQIKKQLVYKSTSGKTLLTTNDGETHIMKAGDKESVNCAATDVLAQKPAPEHEASVSTSAPTAVSTAAPLATVAIPAVSSVTTPAQHNPKQKETEK